MDLVISLKKLKITLLSMFAKKAREIMRKMVGTTYCKENAYFLEPAVNVAIILLSLIFTLFVFK